VAAGKTDMVDSYIPYPKVDEEAVRQAAELINNAKKPMALVGHGVEIGQAQAELMQLLETADIPAGLTLLGLSVLPTDYPLNVGMLGMHGRYAPTSSSRSVTCSSPSVCASTTA
jgi:acetolactate synthase-1/2/3 large subunit